MKRKCTGDDFGSMIWLAPSFKNAKRQKYGNGCEEITARGCGEESNGSRLIHPLVSQPIHKYEEETDKVFFQSYKPPIGTNSVTESSEPYSRHTWNESPVQYSLVSADKADAIGTTNESRKRCKETMNITDRKQHFIYTPDDGMKEKMKNYVYDVYRFFSDSRSEDNCWLHPSPPVRRNGRPAGSIQRNFVWKDSSGIHILHVNFGIIALIVEHHLTGEQMEGYVNKAWHLSHLCGNWVCCNWRHMTVESAGINTSRNRCFPVTTHCPHDPPCMKDRKRRLLVTLDISNQIKRAIESSRNGAKPTADCQNINLTAAGFDCGICGNEVNCFGGWRICRSLTSIKKSQEALEELESCSEPSEEILKAITHLKWIIADLIREKEASDAVFLERAVAQREMDQSAHWSQKQFSSYGQMLANLLD